MKLLEKEKAQLLQLGGNGSAFAARFPNNASSTRNKKIEIIDIDIDGPEVTIKIDPDLSEMINGIKLENNGTEIEEDEEFHSTSSAISASVNGNKDNNNTNKPVPSTSNSSGSAGSLSSSATDSSNSILNQSNESLAEIAELPGLSAENSVIIVDS